MNTNLHKLKIFNNKIKQWSLTAPKNLIIYNLP